MKEKGNLLKGSVTVTMPLEGLKKTDVKVTSPKILLQKWLDEEITIPATAKH